MEQLNYFLALGTVALQILALAFLALFFLQKRFPDLKVIASFLNRRGLWLGFFLALGATSMTWYYSDVLGFIPCGWCWVQRVFLWSQVPLFGVALWKCSTSDVEHPMSNIRRDVADYSIALSILGGLAALYQHYIQMGGTSVLPCPASGAGDCAQRIIFEFGYVTFPLMAATLFAFLIVLMLFVRHK
ncbi:MAG TPA: disulfide bond formation protein B [Candidatus Paceibacterota bacterium]